MPIFQSAEIYIQSSENLKDKICRIEAIIKALEDKALTAIVDEDVMEYTLDDGQTKIKTIFRGVGSILRAIQGYEQLLQMYANRFNGRITVLRDRNSQINH